MFANVDHGTAENRILKQACNESDINSLSRILFPGLKVAAPGMRGKEGALSLKSADLLAKVDSV